ncbi:MAG: hypothetical protein ACX932_06335 [Gammaproteobacteria bacterium]
MKLLKKLMLCGVSSTVILSHLGFAEESLGVETTATTPIAHHASVVIDNATEHSFSCHMESNASSASSATGSINPGLMGKMTLNWTGDDQRLHSNIRCVSNDGSENTPPAMITMTIQSTDCSLGVILADAIVIPIAGLANRLNGQTMPEAVSCDSFDLAGRGNGYSVATNMRSGNFNNYLFYFKLTQNP